MAQRNRVEISYGALQHNVRVIRAAAQPRALIAVVKADAYGLGVERCARIYVEAGVAGVAVATVGEAQRVAAAVPATRIMLLGSPLPEERQAVVDAGCDVWVSSGDEILDFATRAHPQRPARVHLAVDTGMGRSGCRPDQAMDLVRLILSQPNLRLVGVATHYPQALDAAFALQQEQAFAAFVAELQACMGRFADDFWIHQANSEGLLVRPMGPCTAVRVGILLTGVSAERIAGKTLRPALRWRSAVTLVKELPAGHSISYNRTCILTRPTRVALISVGYADGYPFQCSGKGASVLIRGCRCAILGRVTMDYLVVDVSDLQGVPVPGEEVVLVGEQGGAGISVAELAQWADSIPYDIICGFRGRCEILGVP
ncbi:MAG: alanine racemase [Planctomycetota bacterium]|nr:MAG: alanine racemase [Planctomycetota bacterium]